MRVGAPWAWHGQGHPFFRMLPPPFKTRTFQKCSSGYFLEGALGMVDGGCPWGQWSSRGCCGQTELICRQSCGCGQAISWPGHSLLWSLTGSQAQSPANSRLLAGARVNEMRRKPQPSLRVLEGQGLGVGVVDLSWLQGTGLQGGCWEPALEGSSLLWSGKFPRMA